MPIRRSPNGARHVRPQPGRNRPEWVVAINRNARSQSVGTGGRNHPVRSATAKAYVAKTFGLTLFVPPPILANWRDYLLRQLQAAFPDHNDNERIAARDAFDLAKSNRPEPITPREIKLFVNSLVAIYREERDDNITLVVMASFAAHRDEILESGIREDLLSREEIKMLGVPEWQSLFAALHYGVRVEEARQLRLLDPIVNALRSGVISNLKELEKKAGFYHVLPGAVRTVMSSVDASTGSDRTRLAAQLSGLEGWNLPALSGIWDELRHEMQTPYDWEGFMKPVDAGFKALLNSAPASERAAFAGSLAEILKTSAISEQPALITGSTKNWLNAANTLAEYADTVKLVAPGSPPVAIEFLQQLAANDLKQPDFIRVKATPASITAELSNRFTAGDGLRDPIQFVRYMQRSGTALNWPGLIESINQRLSAAQQSANETDIAVTFLLAASSIIKVSEGLQALQTLSVAGHLSNYIFAARGNPGYTATLLLAALLANPAIVRTGQVGSSAQGDEDMSAFINGSDEKKIGDVGSLVRSLAGC